MKTQNTHLRKYKNRPSQTYIEGIGWVRDSELNKDYIKQEIERINKRKIKKCLHWFVFSNKEGYHCYYCNIKFNEKIAVKQ